MVKWWKLKGNKTMSSILLFFQILRLKQQNNFLCCFCSSGFENALFSAKLFSWTIFRSNTIVYTTGKVQIKYCFKKISSHSFMGALSLEFAASVINCFFKFSETYKKTYSERNVLQCDLPPHQIEQI